MLATKTREKTAYINKQNVAVINFTFSCYNRLNNFIELSSLIQFMHAVTFKLGACVAARQFRKVKNPWFMTNQYFFIFFFAFFQ